VRWPPAWALDSLSNESVVGCLLASKDVTEDTVRIHGYSYSDL
jgi:hypothetical protein